jgi:hypothetical protein
VNSDLKANSQETKQWRKIYYPQKVRRAVPFPRSGSMRILFGEPTHIHIEKYFRGRHIPECAQVKVIAQERKLKDTFLGMFSSRSWSKIF